MGGGGRGGSTEGKWWHHAWLMGECVQIVRQTGTGSATIRQSSGGHESAQTVRQRGVFGRYVCVRKGAALGWRQQRARLCNWTAVLEGIQRSPVVIVGRWEAGRAAGAAGR